MSRRPEVIHQCRHCLSPVCLATPALSPAGSSPSARRRRRPRVGPHGSPVAGYNLAMAGRRERSHELDAAERNAMSDSTYAFPRVRKEPLNDASHVRNAIARFDQVRDVTNEERREAFRRIQRAADKFGVEMSATRWQDLGKPSATMKSSDKPRTPTKAERRLGRWRTVAGRAVRRGAAPQYQGPLEDDQAPVATRTQRQVRLGRARYHQTALTPASAPPIRRPGPRPGSAPGAPARGTTRRRSCTRHRCPRGGRRTSRTRRPP